MWTPGMGELFIILIIVLVLFGGTKIAGLGRSLGTAIAEFK
jgi:sec-independent protein translocase protein TatA